MYYSSNAYIWQLLATWKALEGVCMRTRQKNFFQWLWSVSLCVLSESGLQCNASVSWPVTAWWLALAVNQTVAVCLAIICECLWTSKAFSIFTDLSLPSSAEASESRSKHDWTHRVGSQRWLVLETACSDPPTDAQCNRNAHALSCTNFAAVVGAGQLVAMVAHGRAWHIARILGCAPWNQKWKR